MIKIQTNIPDKYKWYPVRAGNSLTELRKWIKWARKTMPKQKLIIVNFYKIRMMEDKNSVNYWKMRYKAGLEDKYMVYGNY